MSANGTETVAHPLPDGTFELYGYKWFSSATDSDMSLALARIVNEDGSCVQVQLATLISGREEILSNNVVLY